MKQCSFFFLETVRNFEENSIFWEKRIILNLQEHVKRSYDEGMQKKKKKERKRKGDFLSMEQFRNNSLIFPSSSSSSSSSNSLNEFFETSTPEISSCWKLVAS